MTRLGATSPSSARVVGAEVVEVMVNEATEPGLVTKMVAPVATVLIGPTPEPPGRPAS